MANIVDLEALEYEFQEPEAAPGAFKSNGWYFDYAGACPNVLYNRGQAWRSTGSPGWTHTHTATNVTQQFVMEAEDGWPQPVEPAGRAAASTEHGVQVGDITC